MILSLIATMTLQIAPADNLRAAQAFFDAFNRRDMAAMEALYAPNAVLTSSDFCKPRGRADLRRTYQTLFEGQPDIQDVVDTMVAEGDYVAVRFHAIAKAGPRPTRLPLMSFLRFKDGLIVEDDTIFDTKGRACEP